MHNGRLHLLDSLQVSVVSVLGTITGFLLVWSLCWFHQRPLPFPLNKWRGNDSPKTYSHFSPRQKHMVGSLSFDYPLLQLRLSSTTVWALPPCPQNPSYAPAVSDFRHVNLLYCSAWQEFIPGSYMFHIGCTAKLLHNSFANQEHFNGKLR